jgi:hypothetical protein
MVKYLNELAFTGVEIWYSGNRSWLEMLNDLSTNITRYLKQRPHLRYYIVTDPDIGLNGTADDLLLFMAGILNACPRVDVVGPALQISNLPTYYEKRDAVYKHESQFWTTVPGTAMWKDKAFHLAVQPLDTTFALRRSTFAFRRLTGVSVRTYAPYMAIHLDWYLNSSSPDNDYQWYLRNQRDVNHWR